LEIDQLSVDDCPLSMVDGSAVKLLISGFPTLGVDLPPPSEVGGGGAGRGGGVFFPHASANITNARIRRMAPILDLLLSRILNKLLFAFTNVWPCSKRDCHYCLA
jgi:hypothetical protein